MNLGLEKFWRMLTFCFLFCYTIRSDYQFWRLNLWHYICLRFFNFLRNTGNDYSKEVIIQEEWNLSKTHSLLSTISTDWRWKILFENSFLSSACFVFKIIGLLGVTKICCTSINVTCLIFVNWRLGRYEPLPIALVKGWWPLTI